MSHTIRIEQLSIEHLKKYSSIHAVSEYGQKELWRCGRLPGFISQEKEAVETLRLYISVASLEPPDLKLLIEKLTKLDPLGNKRITLVDVGWAKRSVPTRIS